MASAISHIVYAKKYFDRMKSGELRNEFSDPGVNRYLLKNKDEFILGAVFPDIRRICNNIKRSDTHSAFEIIDLNFEGLTAFQSGWKFHLYCDMRREEILNKYGFYSIKGAADHCCGSAKLLEDELVYDRYDNWEKLVCYFNNSSKIEVDLGALVARPTLDLWYAILAKYMERKPDEKSMHIFLSKLPSLAEKADEVIESIERLRKKEKAVEILRGVMREIV